MLDVPVLVIVVMASSAARPEAIAEAMFVLIKKKWNDKQICLGVEKRGMQKKIMYNFIRIKIFQLSRVEKICSVQHSFGCTYVIAAVVLSRSPAPVRDDNEVSCAAAL